MGRPSVRDQRREEIIDAVQKCIVDFGLTNTTLARIAERAGMQQSAIAHFVGNRDEVINAALERSTDFYEEVIGELEGQSLTAVLDATMGGRVSGRLVRPEAMLLFDEMLTLAPRDEKIRRHVEHALAQLHDLINRRLEIEHPDATAERLRAVGVAIMLIVDDVERLAVLDVIPAGSRADARRAVDILISTLRSSSRE
jgi:AcrR family transcriptional regulator